MRLAQIAQAVSRGIDVFTMERRIVAELDRRQRIVDDEARAADQMPMAAIVDRAVVLEVVEEAAGRIDRVRVIERHRLCDVFAQENGRTEVGCNGYGAHACCSMKVSTSSPLGIAANEPWRVTVSAPQAAAKRSIACRRGSSVTS